MTDLDTIMNDRTETHDQNQPEPSQIAPEPVADGQARDEHGRFAGQQPPEATPAQPEVGKPPEGYLPIQALDARLSKQEEKYQAQLREQAEAFQRQIAAFQTQQPKVPEAPKPAFNETVWENPEAAFDSRLNDALSPLQKQQQGIVENFSRMMASDKFGEDTVNAALAEMTSRVNANPQQMRFDYQRIMSAPHPYGELVKWHKTQSALSQYGDDPTAYEAKLREKIMAEIQAQPPAQQAAPGVDPASLPSSFSRNSGLSATPGYSGPRPLSDIMNGR